MDADNLMVGGVIAIFFAIILGTGWLISRDQDDVQERALACIAAGRQFVSGDCVSGPDKP